VKRGPPSFRGRRKFTTKSTKDTKNGIRELSNRVASVKTGLLMNFNAINLKSGINRFVLCPLCALRCARLSLADLVDCEVSTM
jgi:hypothetical protein